MMPRKAMILCAGFGTRMRPLTDVHPKPLVPVQGRAIVDYIFDHLAAANIFDVAVNGHYLSDQMKKHVQGKKDFKILFSHEAEILETGGGVVKVLDHFGDDPFFVINGDAFWVDGEKNIFQILADGLDDQKDVVLGLVPHADVGGDYDLNVDGTLQWRGDKERAGYDYMGVHVMRPRLLRGLDVHQFSLKKIWDQQEQKQKLYGVVYDGDWYHLSTPDDILKTENILNNGGQL